MFEGHDPYLVALSLAVAIMGGYTGFSLAARIRAGTGAGPRLLLAGAAGFLAVGIWTMHFVGMMAAPLPPDAAYLVLPTIVSFLICALVVGVSLFFVSIGEPSEARVSASAVLLGAGIVSMHYVGIHGLAGPFSIEHERAMVLLAALVAIGTAYGVLRAFLAGHGGRRLAVSAVVFGIAVSGMHYTAMYGMVFRNTAAPREDAGLVASPDVVALVLALLCFLVAAGFLLSLVPEPRRRARAAAQHAGPGLDAAGLDEASGSDAVEPAAEARAGIGRPPRAAPLGGLGQAPLVPATRLPVEGADGTHFLDVAEVRGLKADAHYTLVHDGGRERMCPWSISEAEARLDPAHFVRVHRSHIVALPHVILVRREGDGAVVELGGEVPHRVPVSRARIAELKARLGLARRGAAAQ